MEEKNLITPQEGVQTERKFENAFIDKGFNYANRTDATTELVGKGLDDIYQFFLHG